jgi:hypothetical protein
MGACSPNDSTFCSGIVAGISGVQTGPGATALTRIRRSCSACASEYVSALTAPLVAA